MIDTPDKLYIDVSHTVEDGMLTYHGLPAPVICDYWSREYSQQFYAEGTSFHIGKIEMVANTGTAHSTALRTAKTCRSFPWIAWLTWKASWCE